MANGALPSGTVTFLFTDIEGSSRLWEQHPDAMRVALEDHDRILRDVLQSCNGYVFKTGGDAFYCAFYSALDGVRAAVNAQRSLAEHTWPSPPGPLKVRMALHSGTSIESGGDYFGPTLNRVARLLSLAFGEQILLSAATANLAREQLPDGIALRDLGSHRLRDLAVPEGTFQVTAPGLRMEFPALSAEGAPSNLPQQLSSFVGRRRELDDLRELLRRTRLLTLTGPGGIGKTRLSIQLAAEELANYPDGEWLIELASVPEEAAIPYFITAALGVREEPPQQPLETVVSFLRKRRALLVLDNCEHLAAACARLSTRILTTSKDVRIVATSREPLHVTGELTWPVPALSFNGVHEDSPLENIAAVPAVQLFLDRAKETQPAFTLNAGNAQAILQICRRLDGIPLAMELAASRLRALQPQEIADGLDNRFRLLTGGDRSRLPRQQTLRNTIDWSYDTLNESERTFFNRSAAFVDGFTREAAESVCRAPQGQPEESGDELSSLIDKSFFSCDQSEERTRYHCLETLRQYALEKLSSNEKQQALTSCRRYYADYVEKALPNLSGPEQKRWLSQIVAETANIRALVQHALEEKRDLDVAIRLALAASKFWQMFGAVGESRHLLRSLLEVAAGGSAPRDLCSAMLSRAATLANVQGSHEEAARLAAEALRSAPPAIYRAEALQALGGALIATGDYETATLRLREALQIYQDCDDPEGQTYAFTNLGLALTELGRYTEAEGSLRDALRLANETQNERLKAWVHGTHGYYLRLCNKWDRAKTAFLACLRVFRELGDLAGTSSALGQLADVAFEKSDIPGAARYLSECLEAASEAGLSHQAADAIALTALLAAKCGDVAGSARLIFAADSLRKRSGYSRSAADRDNETTLVAQLQSEQPEATLTQWKTEAASMTLEAAVKEARTRLSACAS